MLHEFKFINVRKVRLANSFMHSWRVKVRHHFISNFYNYRKNSKMSRIMLLSDFSQRVCMGYSKNQIVENYIAQIYGRTFSNYFVDKLNKKTFIINSSFNRIILEGLIESGHNGLNIIKIFVLSIPHRPYLLLRTEKKLTELINLNQFCSNYYGNEQNRIIFIDKNFSVAILLLRALIHNQICKNNKNRCFILI